METVTAELEELLTHVLERNPDIESIAIPRPRVAHRKVNRRILGAGPAEKAFHAVRAAMDDCPPLNSCHILQAEGKQFPTQGMELHTEVDLQKMLHFSDFGFRN